MASLTEVVEELRGQNDTLEDVKSSLKSILDVDIAGQREAASQELQDKENAIEARRSKAANMSGAPKSMGAGVSKAFGIDSLLGGLQGLGAGFLAGASTLGGGASLGGLLGLALGKTFIGAAGAYFGSQMFSDEMVNKLIPDVLEDINITKDIKVGDIAAELGGAFLLLFGPKLIKGIFKTGFGYISSLMIAKIAVSSGQDLLGEDGKKNIDDETKKGKKRFGRRLSGGIGIASLLAFVGAGIGEEVGKLTGSEELGDAISAAAVGAGLGSMFGPKGAIIGAAIGLAYAAGVMLYGWMQNTREEATVKLKEDLDRQNKEFKDALESGDLEAASQVLNNDRIRVDTVTNEGLRDAYTQNAAQRNELADALTATGQIEEANKRRYEAAMMGFVNTTDPAEKISILKDFQKLTGLDKTTAIERLNPNYKSMYQNPDTTMADMFRALPDKFVDSNARPDNFDNTSMPASRLIPSDPYSKLREKVTSPYMVPFGPVGGLGGSGSTEQGLLPELPMRPLGSVSSPVANQTIDPEDAKVINNNSVVVNNFDNSDRKMTNVSKGGDSPILLPGLVNATDTQFFSKMDRMMGGGLRVGNSYP